MKLISLQIIVISYLLSSCCAGGDSVETGKYKLSEKEKELIPYSENQRIGFKSDSGDEFDFIVTHESVEWKKMNDDNARRPFCESDFFYSQNKKVVLESEIPSFNIKFFMDSRHHKEIEDSDNYYEYNLPFFDVSINDFSFPISYDSLSNISCEKYYPIEYMELHKSIQINNRVYKNVLESKYTSNNEKEEAYPSSIFYSNEGLLQIIMSDNKIYYINN